LAISVFFPCFALLAEAGRWLYGGLLVDVYGILSAVLTPMPPVPLASPNIFHHLAPRFSLLHPTLKVIYGVCLQEAVFQIISALLSLNKDYWLPVQHKYYSFSSSALSSTKQVHNFLFARLARAMRQFVAISPAPPSLFYLAFIFGLNFNLFPPLFYLPTLFFSFFLF
jgi:hypothetical protein